MNAKKAGLAAGTGLAALLTPMLSPGAFPRFGQWLRTLSLSGSAGNAGAWTIVLLLSALPALGLLRRGRRRWDWLLGLASAQILAGLYFLVNPSLLNPMIDTGGLWGLAAAGGVGATLLAWAVLRGLDRLNGAVSLGSALAALLEGAGCMLLVLTVWSSGTGLYDQMEKVAAGNTAVSDQLFPTYCSLALLAAAGFIPSLLVCMMLLWSGNLARVMETDPFGAQTVSLAERLSRWCAGTAAVSVLTCAGGNALQMLLFPVLRHVSASISFPVSTVLLAAALELLCRYIQGAKAVNDDNESII